MAIKVLVINDYSDDAVFHTARPDSEIFVGLARLGLEVYIMTPGNSVITRRFRECGVHLIDYSPDRKLNRRQINCIRKHLVDGQFDILHLFYSTSIVNGLIAARGLPVKVVLYRGFAGHIHWYDPTAYFKYLSPRVDMIMCNSEATAETIRKQFFFPRKKTVVISKGHDVRWYDDVVPVDVRKKYEIPDDALIIVHVSNYRKIKGMGYLLEAMNMLPAGLPVHLLIVGKHHDNADNLRIIEQGPYRNNIHLLGFQSDPFGIVASCDVFALTSVRGEAITRALVEAMAMRVTPVISDLPGNRGVVVHGKNGLVVPLRDAEKIRDAFLYLVQNREACREMGRQARLHIQENLSNKQAVLKVKEMYEKLVAGTR